MHFILIYDVVDDYIEKRKPFRPAHFEHAQRAFDAGELVLAGALADPVDGAMFIFRGPTPEAARLFAEKDPYVLNGLAKAWRIRTWTTVLGDGLTLPTLP
jgi:uncharacterized protein